jgi:hypothetical protein
MAFRTVPFDPAAYQTGVMIVEGELLATSADSAWTPKTLPVEPASDQAAARAGDMARGMAGEALGQLYALEGMGAVLLFVGYVVSNIEAARRSQQEGAKS